MLAHPIKTGVDVVLGVLVAVYLFLCAHWIPVMNGLAATAVAATCVVRLVSAVRDYRRGRSEGAWE